MRMAPSLGGEGRGGTAGQDDAGDQHAELAQHADAHQLHGEDLPAILAKQVLTHEGQGSPDEEGGGGADRQGVEPGPLHLRDRGSPAEPSRVQRQPGERGEQPAVEHQRLVGLASQVDHTLPQPHQQAVQPLGGAGRRPDCRPACASRQRHEGGDLRARIQPFRVGPGARLQQSRRACSVETAKVVQHPAGRRTSARGGGQTHAGTAQSRRAPVTPQRRHRPRRIVPPLEVRRLVHPTPEAAPGAVNVGNTGAILHLLAARKCPSWPDSRQAAPLAPRRSCAKKPQRP